MYTKLNIYSDGFLSYAAAFIISYAVFIYNRLGVLKSLTLSLIVGFFAAATVFIIKNFTGIKHGEKARRKNNSRGEQRVAGKNAQRPFYTPP